MDKIAKPGKAAVTARAAWTRWLRCHPYAILALVVFAAIAYPLITRRYSEWNEVYIRAANHLRAGDGIYHIGEGYVYPPFMALLAVPFTFASKFASLSIWYVINVAAAFILCHFAWRISTGSRRSSEAESLRKGWHEHVIWLLGLAVGVRYVFDGLSHQQTDIVIGALLMYGCWALVRSQSWIAATCFGVAAGAKCTPLLWCGYLLWRRRWRQAGWVVVVAIAINLLPNVVFPSTSSDLYAAQWMERCLGPLSQSSHYVYSEQVYNQSFAGAVNRWFTTALSSSPAEVLVADVPAAIGSGARKLLLCGFDLAVVVAVFAVFRRGRANESGRVWECCTVLLLMVLLSPMSSKPHFCTLLLPGFCLARRIVEKRETMVIALLTAAIVAGAIGTRGLVGRDLATEAMWYGNVMWSAVLLLLGCGYVRYRESRAEPRLLAYARNAKDCYPLITPMGRIRATFRESPARSTTSTTSSTFL